MGGVDLHAVGQGEEGPVQAVPEVAGRALAAQVRPAHVANEEGVPGEHEPRLGPAAPVGHQQADAVWRVAWGVEHPEVHVADQDLFAIADGEVIEYRAGGVVEQDRRPGQGGEVPVAGDVVGVRVRLDDPRDPEALAPREPNILVDPVPPGVDHDGLAGLPAAHEVRQTARLLVLKLVKDHPGLII
jgi:hypothetical protein